jgi:hypothetical protein
MKLFLYNIKFRWNARLYPCIRIVKMKSNLFEILSEKLNFSLQIQTEKKI